MQIALRGQIAQMIFHPEPPRIESPIRFGQVDEEIEAGSIPVILSSGDVKITHTVNVTLILSPYPEMILTANITPETTFIPMRLAVEDCELIYPTTKQPLPSHFTAVRAGSDQAAIVRWKAASVHMGAVSASADHVIAHIFSMPHFHGTTRTPVLSPGTAGDVEFLESIDLDDEDFTYIISSHPGTKRIHRELKQGGRYGITHLVRVQRRDGMAIDLETSRGVLLDRLHRFFSFLAGRRIGVGILCGMDDQGGCLWKEWRIGHSAPWNGNTIFGCWPIPFDQGMAAALWPGYVKWATSSTWSTHSNVLLYWHMEANQLDRGVVATDTGIILSQVALERLSFVYLTEVVGTSRNQVSKLSAKKLIEEVAGHLRLPLLLPDRMTSEVNWTGDGQLTVAKVITAVRNNEVHPKPSPELKTRAYVAWNLAQWYLEMMVLCLCGYSGPYNDRAQQCIGGWRMSAVETPWSLGDSS